MTARQLLACAACGRQYDVSHLSAGTRIRCECGARPAVTARESRPPRAMNCWNCGAPFADGEFECDYCGSEITLEEKHLDSVCPKCFARMSSDAKYCMECGTSIAPQALAAIPEHQVCPRCAGNLRARQVGGDPVVECASCAGLWLPAGMLERVCDRSDEQQVALQWLASRSAPARADVPEAAVVYLACLKCGDRMVRRNFGGISGVVIDVCRDHGVWLDHSELGKILGFVRNGGLSRAREREAEQARAEMAALRSARHGAGRYDPDLGGILGDRDVVEFDVGGAIAHVASVFRRWIQRR